MRTATGRHSAEREEMFLAKVVADANTGCWIWVGSVKPNGYGAFRVAQNEPASAHRWAYEHWRGPLPAGLVPDHTCHDPETCSGGSDCPHRRCVNPWHLEAVTHAENVLRGHSALRGRGCRKGHPVSRRSITASGESCLDCKKAARDARKVTA